MSPYCRILAAIDLTDDSRAVAARACELARPAGGAVQLLHVVEYVPIEPMGDALVPVVQIDEQILARSRAQIEALARELGIPATATGIEAGNVKAQILRCAREQSIDLIVIGRRGRQGLSSLVHHTEDSVLHGAPCDVLAVRVS